MRALLAPLERLDLRARQEAREAREALERLDLLAALDPLDLLEPKEAQDQVEDQQEPLGLLAPLVLLLRLEQMAKCNTTMAALQWAEPQNFTTMTVQIE